MLSLIDKHHWIRFWHAAYLLWDTFSCRSVYCQHYITDQHFLTPYTSLLSSNPSEYYEHFPWDLTFLLMSCKGYQHSQLASVKPAMLVPNWITSHTRPAQKKVQTASNLPNKTHKILDHELPSKMGTGASAHENQSCPGLQHLQGCVVSPATDGVHSLAAHRKAFSSSSYRF